MENEKSKFNTLPEIPSIVQMTNTNIFLQPA